VRVRPRRAIGRAWRRVERRSAGIVASWQPSRCSIAAQLLGWIGTGERSPLLASHGPQNQQPNGCMSSVSFRRISSHGTNPRNRPAKLRLFPPVPTAPDAPGQSVVFGTLDPRGVAVVAWQKLSQMSMSISSFQTGCRSHRVAHRTTADRIKPAARRGGWGAGGATCGRRGVVQARRKMSIGRRTLFLIFSKTNSAIVRLINSMRICRRGA
jgi:hypothetical protein